MKQFKNYFQALEEAQKYFIDILNHSGNVGQDKDQYGKYFYSKDDPGMEDVFYYEIIN